jgi:hypothetical protein
MKKRHETMRKRHCEKERTCQGKLERKKCGERKSVT